MKDHGVHELLRKARQTYSQSRMASLLGVDVRTIRRWEVRECSPPPYLADAIRQLALPFPTEEGPGTSAFTFADLFAGIGGIRLGFESQGGRCVFASEWNAFSQKTYLANFVHDPDHQFVSDITTVDENDVPAHDVLLAGFPCQPFSIAGVSKKNALGRPHGFECTTQGTLFFDIARILAAKRPKAFLLENVKNLVSHDKGNTFRVILQTLREQLGYEVHFKVIDGKHFVPQHRERLLIVGFRNETDFSWSDLEVPAEGPKLATILHPQDGTEQEEIPYTVGPKAKVNAKYTLSLKLWEYLQAYAEKHRAAGNGFGFGLVDENDIARTLSARYYKDGSEILVYQGNGKRPRRLTPRECARLMGYPDSFKIPVSDTQAYRQFSQSAVVPMISALARIVAGNLTKTVANMTPEIQDAFTDKGNWSKDQLKLAFHLYCQLSFGKMHSRNPEVVELSNLIGRSANALAMKLVNFASLDPSITGTGRKGLSGVSKLDREVWAEFNQDWERLAVECEYLKLHLMGNRSEEMKGEALESEAVFEEDFAGETRRVLTEQRIKQQFFRRSVLSSYKSKCCISGLSDARLLVASHIVPWGKDKQNRLNPCNGLCLSAIHDRAFDRGLFTIDANYRVLLSSQILSSEEDFLKVVFHEINGRSIKLPDKFLPDARFLTFHRQNIFLNRATI